MLGDVHDNQSNAARDARDEDADKGVYRCRIFGLVPGGTVMGAGKTTNPCHARELTAVYVFLRQQEVVVRIHCIPEVVSRRLEEVVREEETRRTRTTFGRQRLQQGWLRHARVTGGITRVGKTPRRYPGTRFNNSTASAGP